MPNTQKIVDGFRFIASLNTQVRILSIVSQIAKIIGSKQLPKQFLKSSLIKWSVSEEQKSPEYKNHRGKITENGKPTAAFEHYIEFASSLGLVSIHGDILMLTRLGLLLHRFLNQSKEIESQLSNKEKYFYLMTLFRNDADALLLTIDLLTQGSEFLEQERLLEMFEAKLKERLLIKQKYANERVQSIIRERYRVVEYEWKNAKSYSRHIIPPRLEWMADLGMLRRTKNRGVTYYQLTNRGQELYDSCLTLPDSNLYDINENWLRTKSMKSFAPMINDDKILKTWSELNKTKRLDILKPYLEQVFDYFNYDGAMRISSYYALLYIIINIAVDQGILVEFQDLEEELKNSILVGNRKYSIRLAPRVNEGYITINLIQQ